MANYRFGTPLGYPLPRPTTADIDKLPTLSSIKSYLSNADSAADLPKLAWEAWLLIAKKGAPVTISKVATQTVSVSTGEATTPPAAPSFQSFALEETNHLNFRQQSLFQNQTAVLLIPGLNALFNPVAGDTIIWAGKSWSINVVDPFRPDGITTVLINLGIT